MMAPLNILNHQHFEGHKIVVENKIRPLRPTGYKLGGRVLNILKRELFFDKHFIGQL